MNDKKAMYIIDEQHRIIYTNQKFKEYYPEIVLMQKCHEALAHTDNICTSCPINCNEKESTFYNTITQEWINAHAVEMDWDGKQNYHAIFFSLLREKSGADTPDVCCQNKNLIDTIITEDPHGCFLIQYLKEDFPVCYANTNLVKFLGYSTLEEMINHRGNSRSGYIHPDDKAKITPDTLSVGMTYNKSFRILRKDGSYLSVADRGKVVEENGKLLLVSQFSDMSGMLRMQSTIEMENKALQQQNEELKYMKNRRPGGYHCCYKESGFPFKYISQQFCDLLGYTKQEIEDKFDNKLINMIVREDRNKLDTVNNIKKVGGTLNIQYRMMTKGRDIIWVKGNVRLSKFDETLFYQATIVEITNEMKTQQELEQKNRELELILSAIPGGLKNIEINENYSYRFISEEAAALFGYSAEELMNISGGTAFEMVYPEDRAYVRREMKKCVAEGRNDYSLRYRIKCKDGSIKYILACGRKTEDEDGNPYFRSLYIDITKEMESAGIIQQLQLIRALSNDYSDVYLLDLKSRRLKPIFQHEKSQITHINKEHLTDWVMQLAEEMIHPEDRKIFLEKLSLENINSTLQVKEMFHHNYRSEKDGITSHWQVKCVGIKENSRITKTIVGFHNIDEEVQIEEERNQALHNALMQAQYANKAKTTFLNNMSHDIRTPMNAITGFTTLALTHIDDTERVKDYLRKITQSSNHLLSLINDVLDMSRIESGKMCIVEKPENLSEIMSEIRNIMQADINSKRLRFEMEVLDVTDEIICCDKLRINQILLNLLSNAVKFTAPGGVVAMTVSQRKSEIKGYADYEFRIRDTGIGMEKNFLNHIFEPFVQERPSTHSGIQGTGLGMAITKNIVDMCGGKIKVESTPAKGTDITVTLPFRTVTEDIKIKPIKELEGLRALVVDDDMNTCQNISKMLRQFGLRVDWTVYGKEAVVRSDEAVEIDDAYQLYIVDWLMPDMNGIETVRQIRKTAGNEPPVILLSAYDCTDVEDEAKDAGVTAFTAKPLFMSELRRILLQVYDKTDNEKQLTDIEELKGKKVLVVEDNEINQEISVDILSTVGISAEVAENGQIALDMLNEKGAYYYSMIFMDIQMPVMDGYETAKRIRRLEETGFKKIPIVAMTANAYEDDKKMAFDVGMNAHIAKPIEISKLIDTLCAMIK